MRSIGTLNNKTHAQRFSAYLYIQGLPNDLETQDEKTWTVWVHSDDDLEAAAGLLEEFLANPENPKYDQAIRKALKQKAEDKSRQEKTRVRYIDARTRLPGLARPQIGKVTLTMIVISVAVFLFSSQGKSGDFIRHLLFTNYLPPHDLSEIRNGQIWRVITPIFLHFGWLHLVFNMLWLKDLGSTIEYRQGKWSFLLMVLVIGGLSNTGQYFVSGPGFGGMSGVVYGLLGYIWLRGKLDPSSGYYLDRFTAMFMGAWLFICLFGYAGSIANTAHFLGLGIGLAWGVLASGKRGKPGRSRKPR